MKYLINGLEYNKERFYNTLEYDIIEWVHSYINDVINSKYNAVELNGETFKASDIMLNCDPTTYFSLVDNEIKVQLDNLHNMLNKEGHCSCRYLNYKIVDNNEK